VLENIINVRKTENAAEQRPVISLVSLVDEGLLRNYRKKKDGRGSWEAAET
jgi:hypothetical protein